MGPNSERNQSLLASNTHDMILGEPLDNIQVNHGSEQDMRWYSRELAHKSLELSRSL